MSRFTAEEFETAFQQVYPENYPFSEQCKNFLEFLLTNTPENVSSDISSLMDDSNMDDSNRDEINEYLKTIIGYADIDYLMQFIEHINQIGLTSGEIQNHTQYPIFHVVFQMLQNREIKSSASARPLASATTKPKPKPEPPASARAPTGIFTKPRAPPTHKRASTPKRPHPHSTSARVQGTLLSNYYDPLTSNAVSISPPPPPPPPSDGGGSRRRRSSHRKRKGYRKSKRVRHTRRKQTRTHRHRRSRHRR